MLDIFREVIQHPNSSIQHLSYCFYYLHVVYMAVRYLIYNAHIWTGTAGLLDSRTKTLDSFSFF
jgi:hypothetical protein